MEKIGLLAAMDSEMKIILDHMDKGYKSHKIASTDYFEGRIGNTEIAIVSSGEGKVNAAMGTVNLIEKFHPHYVINSGVGGGLSTHIDVFDVVIGKDVFYHDVDLTPLGFKWGEFPKLPQKYHCDSALASKFKTIYGKLTYEGKPVKHVEGDIASGDQFITKANYGAIKEHFPTADVAEMEATAMAHVCHKYGVPFAVIRSISDVVHREGNPVDFTKFVERAANISASAIIELCKM